MTRVAKVRAWSNTVRRDGFGLSDVDLYVMRDVPTVLAALGRRRGDEGDVRRFDRLAEGLLLLAVIAPFFSLVAFGGPVPGNRMIEAGALEDGPATVLTSVLFVLALPGPALVALRWWRSHRHRSWLELLYLVVVAWLGASVHRAMTDEWDVDTWGLPTLPVLATVASAVVVLAAVVVGSRGRRTTGDRDFRVVGLLDEQAVREQVGLLTPARHEQLLSMRERALATLVERGLVQESRAAALESVPLGLSPTLRR